MSRHSKRHLHQTVLALDSQYMPMTAISRRKALKAVATGRAHVLDLRSWAKVCLNDVAGRPFQAVVFPATRAVSEAKMSLGRGSVGVLRRDGYRCQYEGCSRRADTIDHVIPVCQGGKTTFMNLVAACKECNSRKGGRTPEQAGMRLKQPIRSPRALLMERFHELVG